MSHGDCKVNTKRELCFKCLPAALCVLCMCDTYVCVYLLEGVEKLQFSLASEEAFGSASPKEKLSKNISSGSKGKTCFMEQLRKRNVCD